MIYSEQAIPQLIVQAEQAMSASIDPMHDLTHIKRLLLLIEESPFTLTDSLQLMIWWHDVWKSRSFPTFIFRFLIDQIVEGRCSMNLFVTAARATHMSQNLMHEVAYGICEHAAFHLRPRNQYETSRILYELDLIEMYNPERYIHTYQVLKNTPRSFFLLQSHPRRTIMYHYLEKQYYQKQQYLYQFTQQKIEEFLPRLKEFLFDPSLY